MVLVGIHRGLMSGKAYAEVACDGCGCTEHLLSSCINQQLIDSGYITEGKKHFCSDNCQKGHQQALASARDDEHHQADEE